jgi:hypothetical protein
MNSLANRVESRIPAKIVVDLSSLDVRTPAQEGVTENVSPRGARVVTSRAWQPNERLNIRSLLGNFRSRARVVYHWETAHSSSGCSFLSQQETGDRPPNPLLAVVLAKRP